jgi:hypothetical protein
LRIFLASLLLLPVLFNPATAVGTVAGTSIDVGQAEIHHDNRTDYSGKLSVSVAQDFGLSLTIPEGVGPVNPGSFYNFPHTLTNVGNGSDRFTLELSNTTSDWSSTLIKDDNFNGIRDAGENTPAENEILLAEDAVYYFFVVLSAPSAAKKDSLGYTTLTTSGSVNDGSAYTGANGSLYGGADSGLSTVTAQVVLTDTTPPVISDLLISGRKRFAQDIISYRPLIQCKILDNISHNVEKIEIWLNDSLKYSGTSGNWADHYDEETGVCRLTEDQTGPLTAGTYELKIKAWDKTGNLAQETLGPLYVKDTFEVLGPIVNYPNPFRPLKGETTGIAYTLAKDAQITLYIHDIRGTVLYQRTFEPFEEGGRAGYNEVVWNGLSDFKEVLGNGIYIIKLAHANKIVGRGKVTVLDTR